jgi:hypothetical protein
MPTHNCSGQSQTPRLNERGSRGRTRTHKHMQEPPKLTTAKTYGSTSNAAVVSSRTCCWSIAHVWHEQCIFILFARHCPTKSVVPSTHISRSPVFSPPTASESVAFSETDNVSLLTHQQPNTASYSGFSHRVGVDQSLSSMTWRY